MGPAGWLEGRREGGSFFEMPLLSFATRQSDCNILRPIDSEARGAVVE